MSGIVPLDVVRHAALRFDEQAVAAMRRMVQVGLSEIALVAADMPLCLAKDSATGRFDLVALMGLAEPANLFSTGGRFHATYLPRAAALSCFRLDGSGAAGLAIDTGDPAFGPGGRALVDRGAPAPFLAHVREGLERLVADVDGAHRLIDAYATRHLIRPLLLSLIEEDGHEQVLDGLYALDPEALAELPDDDVVAMHRADALAPVGVMAASLAQVERLRQLHNGRHPRRIAAVRLGIVAR